MSSNQNKIFKEQYYQDKLWEYYQNNATSRFDLSYPRLLFLARLFSPNQRILNIGIGSGFLEEKLLQHGVDVYTIDPSEKAIKSLQHKLNLESKAKIAHSNRIPFDNNFFDGLVMTEVLEHLSDDILIETLREVYRVLIPEGLFVGTVPYKEDLFSNQVFCPSCGIVFHHSGHCQIFDRERLYFLLTLNNFKIEKIQCRTFPDWRRYNPRLLFKSIARYFLGRIGEPLVSPNLYFKSRKLS